MHVARVLLSPEKRVLDILVIFNGINQLEETPLEVRNEDFKCSPRP